MGAIVFKLTADSGTHEIPTRPRVRNVGLFANEYRHAFCSYSSHNSDEVLRCVQVLQAAGIDCFLDKLRLKPGQTFEPSLIEQIDRCDVFILFWLS